MKAGTPQLLLLRGAGAACWFLQDLGNAESTGSTLRGRETLVERCGDSPLSGESSPHANKTCLSQNPKFLSRCVEVSEEPVQRIKAQLDSAPFGVRTGSVPAVRYSAADLENRKAVRLKGGLYHMLSVFVGGTHIRNETVEIPARCLTLANPFQRRNMFTDR